MLRVLASPRGLVWGNSYMISRHVVEHRIRRFRIPRRFRRRNASTHRTIAVIRNACESKYLCNGRAMPQFRSGAQWGEAGEREGEEVVLVMI